MNAVIGLPAPTSPACAQDLVKNPRLQAGVFKALNYTAFLIIYLSVNQMYEKAICEKVLTLYTVY